MFIKKKLENVYREEEEEGKIEELIYLLKKLKIYIEREGKEEKNELWPCTYLEDLNNKIRLKYF